MALRLQFSPSRQASGPFDTYYLSRGLTLDFNSTHGTVKGGLSSSFAVPIFIDSPDPAIPFPNIKSATVCSIEQVVGAKLIGIKGSFSTEMAFRVDDHFISHTSLSEELLGRLQILEALVRQRIADSVSIDSVTLFVAREVCATLTDLIQSGKMGPRQLDSAIETFTNQGIPINESFFLYNAQQITEDMHQAILSGCHYFAALTFQMCDLNQNCQILGLSGQSPTEPEERFLMSEEVDVLSFSYTNAIINCYSALDMLYELFVYLTREPFGNPEFPKQLHFPDAKGRKVFQEGGVPTSIDLPNTIYPRAIPNLKAGHFGALRHARNDLVHNMAADGLRPRVYVGWHLPPVRNLPLQYVQYLTRDFDTAGKPATHPLCRRFYETQMDAQDTLFDWIEQTWECIYDTVDWLIYRMRGSSITGG